MEKFVLGETKILICTNIVESGLDIQNANTIIIQDVHQFGLAQLYQVTMPALYLIYCFFFSPTFQDCFRSWKVRSVIFTCKSCTCRLIVVAVVGHRFYDGEDQASNHVTMKVIKGLPESQVACLAKKIKYNKNIPRIFCWVCKQLKKKEGILVIQKQIKILKL